MNYIDAICESREGSPMGQPPPPRFPQNSQQSLHFGWTCDIPIWEAIAYFAILSNGNCQIAKTVPLKSTKQSGE